MVAPPTDLHQVWHSPGGVHEQEAAQLVRRYGMSRGEAADLLDITFPHVERFNHAGFPDALREAPHNVRNVIHRVGRAKQVPYELPGPYRFTGELERLSDDELGILIDKAHDQSGQLVELSDRTAGLNSYSKAGFFSFANDVQDPEAAENAAALLDTMMTSVDFITDVHFRVFSCGDQRHAGKTAAASELQRQLGGDFEEKNDNKISFLAWSALVGFRTLGWMKKAGGQWIASRGMNIWFSLTAANGAKRWTDRHRWNVVSAGRHLAWTTIHGHAPHDCPETA